MHYGNHPPQSHLTPEFDLTPSTQKMCEKNIYHKQNPQVTHLTQLWTTHHNRYHNPVCFHFNLMGPQMKCIEAYRYLQILNPLSWTLQHG